MPSLADPLDRTGQVIYQTRQIGHQSKEEPMRSTRLALVSALAASTLLVGSPARASHSCALDENPTLDQICESHGIDLPIIQKLVCLVLKSC